MIYLFLIVFLLLGTPHLEEAKPVKHQQFFMAPLYCAEDQLLVTGPKYAGLWKINLITGHTVCLTREPRIGFQPLLCKNKKHVIHCAKGQWRKISLEDGRISKLLDPPSFRVKAINDRIFLDGRQISSNNDKFFAPMLGPKGKLVLYQGISKGLFIYQIKNKRTLRMGEGNDPAFSPDGRFIAFSRPLDNGKSIIASDLFLYDLKNKEIFQLTDTPHRLERHPHWSLDGTRLAFDASGKIYTAAIHFTQEE